MRKLTVISVIFTLTIFLALAMTGSALAGDWGQEIDPKDAFDKSKMVRTFKIQGKAPKDAAEEYPLIWSTVEGHKFQSRTFTGTREFEDLALVTLHDRNRFKVVWFSEEGLSENDWRTLTEWPVGWSGEQIEETLAEWIEDMKHAFVRRYLSGMWWYPRNDVISINGEPWQLTEYADTIIERVGEVVKPGEPLWDRNSEAWAMFMDPRTNGAAIIWYKDRDPYFKNVTDPESEYVDLISKYNPLNNGKPFDFSQWQWGGEPDESETEALPEIVIDGEQDEIAEIETNQDNIRQIEIVLGNKQVTIIHRGTKTFNTLEVAPQVKAGRTLIPLRGVLDKLGCILNYDSEQQMVEIKKEEQIIRLFLGDTTAYVNGQKVEMDQPLVIERGRTLVPLRFVSENLGFQVKYDNGKITITE